MSEILSVPEENMEEFIRLLRTGMNHGTYSLEMQVALLKWIEEEEAYLQNLEDGYDDR